MIFVRGIIERKKKKNMLNFFTSSMCTVLFSPVHHWSPMVESFRQNIAFAYFLCQDLPRVL